MSPHEIARRLRKLRVALLGSALLLMVSDAVAGTLTASWVDNSFGFASTRLERRLATDVDFQPLVDVPPGVSSFSDRSVVTGTTYCYRAMAFDDDEQSPYSEEACATALDRLDVTVGKTGTGAGTVDSSPSGINCGTTCAASFGGSATLAATPATGSFFAGWGGSSCSGTDPCTLAGNTEVAVTAAFTEIRYSLSVTNSGGGMVAANPTGISCGSVCSTEYRANTQVGLTATPATGYLFGGWSGACSGLGACTVAMTGPASVTARFVPPLSATCSVPTGEVGIAYGAQCTPTGGVAPYTCSLASGTIPAGVTLSSCALSGTPTTAGTSSFTLRVSDAVGRTFNVSKSATIALPVSVTTTALLAAKLNLSYTTTLAAVNGVKPFTWAVVGSLPAGLALNASTGTITGAPTTLGTNDFSVRVTDALGATALRPLQIVVNLGPLSGTCTPPAGTADIPYSQACKPAGGLPSYTCSLVSGTPPLGLTLNGDCTITGTPTGATSSFMTRIADSAGSAVNVSSSVAIAPHVTITTPALPIAKLNLPYSTTLAAANGVKPFAWSVFGGSLPAGLTLNATTGAITGTPAALGVSDVTLRVTDAAGAANNRALQGVVNLGPLSATCTMPVGEADMAYAGTCNAAGGLPPYSCTLASGTLPDGLTLNSDCTLTGTPTVGGTKSFTARVADSGNSVMNVATSVTIQPHVSVATTTLPKAWVNHAYTTTLTAVGGIKPFTWAVVGGALPAGLTLNPTTGAITGIGTVLGAQDVVFQVTDARGATGSRVLQTVVNLGNLTGTCTMPAGEVDINYSAACTPAAGLPPYSCALAVGTLPTGLTVNSDCTITGTPTVSGTKTFTTRISDSGGLAINVAGSVAIQPHVSVSTTVLPKAWLNHSYTTTLAAVGGIKPFTWAVVGGALPTGLSLNSTTGAITGIGTILGAQDVVFQVTDARGATASRVLQTVVNLGNLTGTCSMPVGEVDINYSGTCTPAAGLPPYSCALAGGTLPTGLTVNSNCTITGTPTVSGTKTFTTRISDSGGLAINVSSSAAIQPHVSVASTTLPTARVNTPYTTMLTAAGGIKPFVWSISGGSLPAGLTLNPSTGAITGNATTLGVVSFTARVADGLGSVGERPLQIATNLGPLSATCTAAGGEVGVPYSGTCTPAGGLPPYSCAVTSGALPTGLTLNSNCSITGTPAVAEAPAFTATISDSGLLSVGVAGRITIVPHVAVGTTTLPIATVNKAYTMTLAGTGGVKPLTWSVIAGSLPAGIVLNPSTGTLSGMPTLVGINDVTMQVADAYGATGTGTLRLVVYPGPMMARCSFGEVGIPYAGCTISGGMPGYSCAMASGTLPIGLTVDSNCSVTGTPDVAGTSSFAFRVTDGAGASATLATSISVVSPVDIATGVLSPGTFARAYSATLRATGGKTAYTWSLVSGALPAGLTLNPTTGVIAGTPTESGASTFRVRVTDAVGGTDEQPLFLAIQ